MFEYLFVGVTDPQDPEDAPPFNHKGTTTDFLEVICQIAKFFGSGNAGSFVEDFLEANTFKLDHLRIVTDWNFEFEMTEGRKIVLKKLH